MNEPFHAAAKSLELQSVRKQIAEFIHGSMDIAVEKVLEDIPFGDLHKDFDSLAKLELQLLLEKEYGFEFEIGRHDRNAKVPNNATELAQELLRQKEQNLTRKPVLCQQSLAATALASLPG